MEKYKKLISNTLIFGIGTFGSKLMVFLLMPLYTRVLSKADYGLVDIIVQSANLMIPIMSFGVANAVLRFGLDRSNRKSDVFSTGIVTVMAGFVILFCFFPLIDKISFISGNIILIYVYALVSSLRSLCSQMTMAKGYVRLYAISGVMNTASTIVFNLLFLLVFRLGITGYVMATVVSDFLIGIFLFFTARLYRHVSLKINTNVSKAMFRYCLPLIPTTIFWWITNVSDRYMVTYILGNAANGLYAVSYKLPTIITLLSGVFIDAWQLSAVSEQDKHQREEFFSMVFSNYQSVVFLAAFGIMLFSKLLTRILVAPDFFTSWQYMPFLLMATTFSCFVTFLGTVYMVEKRSVSAMITTVFGAVSNIAMNLWLIPRIGINGASFATFISYFCVFLLRVLNSRRYLKIRWSVGKLFINMLFLSSECYTLLLSPRYSIPIHILLTIGILMFNLPGLIVSLRRLLFKKSSQEADI